MCLPVCIALQDPSSQDPSMFVRASMSVPGFFQPFEISDIPEDAQSVKNAWAATDYPADQIPKKVQLTRCQLARHRPLEVYPWHMPALSSKIRSYTVLYYWQHAGESAVSPSALMPWRIGTCTCSSSRH